MKRAISLTLLLSLVMSLVACGGGSGNAATPPPPRLPYTYTPPADNGDTWTISHAGTSGFDVATLEDMINDIRDGQYPNVDAVVIAKDGALVLDETIRTRTDFQDDKVGNTDPGIHRIFSISKSVTSLAVGIAIDEGYIANVDVPYLSLFPYPSYANWDPRKDDITLEHVLTMTAGFAWNEWDPPYSDPNNQFERFVATTTDHAKGYLDLPMAADPGTEFAYNTAGSTSLVQAVENSVPMAAIDFGINELLLPMGITDVEVLATPTGLPAGGYGFYFRTRDLAKFGQLHLTGGTWNGERIVGAQWLIDSATPTVTIGWAEPSIWDWNLEGYGYQWWTGSYDFGGQNHASVAGWGFGGQWLIAIPDFGLVIAVNSDGYDGNEPAINAAHALVMNYILPALDQ